jgi:hypothetical protein
MRVLVTATLLGAAIAAATVCGAPKPETTDSSFDPALVQEQKRRIAAFDSVVDGNAVGRMSEGLRGESMPVTDALCGGLPEKQAPYWLRNWSVYPLPVLPPSATDSTPRQESRPAEGMKERRWRTVPGSTAICVV